MEKLTWFVVLVGILFNLRFSGSKMFTRLDWVVFEPKICFNSLRPLHIIRFKTLNNYLFNIIFRIFLYFDITLMISLKIYKIFFLHWNSLLEIICHSDLTISAVNLRRIVLIYWDLMSPLRLQLLTTFRY